MLLLKLCQPFVNANDKQHLIDPQFVLNTTVKPHGGVFDVTGDHAIPRLGGTMIESSTSYNPKNAFIPFCFFFCAHTLHLSIVPGLRQNENLLRHISHYHHEIMARNGGEHGGGSDAIQNDPRFASLIARQRSEDVSLFQEEYIDMVLQFTNFTAKVLYDYMTPENTNENDNMDNSAIVIANMPEEFISDICDIVLTIVTLKPKVLSGHDFRFMFQLFVKLLSPQYATVCTNYNAIILCVWVTNTNVNILA
jgi:Ubiquitin elongating factor core